MTSLPETNWRDATAEELAGVSANPLLDELKFIQVPTTTEQAVDGLTAQRLKALPKKDAAMLGDSGYERIEADHYCTPPENVDCLLQHVNIHPNVWECAAGKGDISQRLTDFGHTVWSSDIIDYGYEDRFNLGDFLKMTKLPDPSIKAIVSNPPYAGDLPEQFIKHALKLMQPVKGQVAMFLRNEYDAGKGRMPLFGLPPFHKKIVVTKRPRWVVGSTGSPRHNYSWFVWDWRHKAGAAGIAYSHPDFAPSPTGLN
jgi:hypothetical protein